MSKSLYIRKLIYEFLYHGEIGEISPEVPEDVRVVHDALKVIARAEMRVSSCTESVVELSRKQEVKSKLRNSQVLESAIRLEEGPVLVDAHDCGAAYRFLMAVLAVTPGQWLLTGTERLLQRPIEELVQCLRSIGADIQWVSDDNNIISRGNDDDIDTSCRDALQHVSTDVKQGWLIHGKPLHASDLTIDCHRSGQFASALWLISGKIGLKELHVLPENSPSASYIEMTKAVMEGKIPMEPQLMGDWSAAVYWYARLLLEGQMRSSNRSHSSCGTAFGDTPASYKLMRLDLHSIQSDAVIVRWFEKWGVKSRQEADGVVISCEDDLIRSQEVIELDMSQNLDLVPVLVCMACLWPKKMVFNGVANLRYKESDRLNIIQEQLSAFANVKVNSFNGVDDNQLVIEPCRDVLQRITDDDTGIFCRDVLQRVSTGNDIKFDVDYFFDAHHDHRFVMGFSLFALKGKVFVKGFDSVRKSYPNFNAEGVVGGTDIVG